MGVKEDVASPMRKVKPSVNQQIKAGLSAVKEFLAGRSGEANVAAPEDKATRDVVAAELLAAMSGSGTVETSTASPEKALSTEQSPENATPQEQERARQLFLDHGYFDETVQNLRAAISPAERAAAARTLGMVGSQRATAHLIAAMFDKDPEVRNAAEEALSQVGNQTGDNVAAVALATDETRVDEAASASSFVKEPEPPIEVAEKSPNATAGAADAASTPASSVQSVEDPSQQMITAPETVPDLTAPNSAAAASEADPLLREEQTISETTAQIPQQILAAATAFKDSEAEVRRRTEREAELQAEATAERLKDEELQKRAEEAVEVRRTRERDAMAAERAARLEAEAESRRYADEETNLRLKAASLRLDAADVARRRASLETARQEAAEANLQAEARRARDEARSRHEAELQRLRGEEEALHMATEEVLLQQTNVSVARDKGASELERFKAEQAEVESAGRAEAERLRREADKRNDEAQEQLRAELEGLRQAGEEVARRRLEVEAAREKADAEEQRLVEAQARIRTAEEARAQAETERSRLEAEINQQVEAQLRLLEETRRQGEEEQERLRDELRLRREKEQQRLTELEEMRTRAEVESKQQSEKEQQILGQIDSLRIADAETRRRIADAEVKRRAADDAYRQIAEKVQRVEAEAHARAKEEERMLAKLESERRNAAIEAQSRAEQEKRIREEIEMFRRLEDEERPRVEAATLQLAQAEARLQERKDRLREGAEARALAEGELISVGASQAGLAEEPGVAENANQEPDRKPSDGTGRPADVSDAGATDEASVIPVVMPAIATYLNSVDPYKRAAAVAELARSGSPDAFSRIVACFDDHSPHVRNAAARALRKLEPDRTVDTFNRALEDASADRRRNIGAAIAASGLATEAINKLASESQEDTYNSLSILFVMAKTGEVAPLVRALEEHRDDEIGKAVSKLLTLSGHGEQAAGADGRSRS